MTSRKRVRKDSKAQLDIKIEQLLNEAIAGKDDELTRRARLAGAGKVNIDQMTRREIWDFVEPPELFQRESEVNRLKRIPGSKTFDAEYRETYMSEYRRNKDRSSSLLDAMLAMVGKNILDLLRQRQEERLVPNRGRRAGADETAQHGQAASGRKTNQS